MVVVLSVSVAIGSGLTVLLVQKRTIHLTLSSGVVLLIVRLLLLVAFRILVVELLGLHLFFEMKLIKLFTDSWKTTLSYTPLK